MKAFSKQLGRYNLIAEWIRPRHAVICSFTSAPFDREMAQIHSTMEDLSNAQEILKKLREDRETRFIQHAAEDACRKSSECFHRQRSQPENQIEDMMEDQLSNDILQHSLGATLRHPDGLIAEIAEICETAKAEDEAVEKAILNTFMEFEEPLTLWDVDNEIHNAATSVNHA